MVNHKTYGKSIFREIRKSAGRFIAIAAIVALGVGFLVGLLSSTPDMKNSIDRYYTENNMTDIFVKGTMGLTDKDIKALEDMEEVEKITSACVMDTILNAEDNGAITGRIYGLNLNNNDGNVNKLTLIDGRFPEKPGEAVVQQGLGEMKDFPLGTKITFSEENEDFDDLDDIYSVEEFTVVGVVKSPFYFGFEREPSFVGNGRLGTVLYTIRESFSMEFETDFYITLNSTKGINTFSDEYWDEVDRVSEKLEALGIKQSEIRYGEVKEEASEKLADAKIEYLEEKSDAEKKLADAWQDILDGKKELNDGKIEIKDAEKEISDGEKEIRDAEKDLPEAKKKLEDAWLEILDGEKEIADAEKKLDDGEKELEENRLKISRGEDELSYAKGQIYYSKDKLSAESFKIEQLKQAIEMGVAPPGAELIVAEYEAGLAEIKRAETRIYYEEINLRNGKNELYKAEMDIEKGKKELEDAKKDLEEGKKEYYDGKEEYEKGLRDLKQAKIDLADGKIELLDAQKEVADAEIELSDGEKEYFEEKAKAEKEFADAEKDIADAQKEILEMEEPEWFVLDRNSNATFASYKVNVEKVSDVAKVFPVFFFLVAALVSLTTMTRMVEEERTQIGVLKALGYSKFAIMSKYLLYCGLATVIGCVLGVLIGYRALPIALNNAYTTLYDLPPFYTEFYWDYTLISCGLEILCTMGATCASAFYALNEKPAFLMRPKAPKAGKRIWLENVKFMWKRMPFSYKATCRNVFRNKKHLFMTVIGISGCTALMLTGFGLKDSIGNVAHEQFENIWKYDLTITLEEEPTSQAVVDMFEKHQSIAVYQEDGKLKDDDNSISTVIFVPQDENKIDEFIKLQNRKNKENFTLNNDGVLITEKAAETMHLKKGDILTVENAEGRKADFNIVGVVENYAGTYVYMTENTFIDAYGKSPEYDDYLIKSGITDAEEKDSTVENLLTCEEVAAVSFTSDVRRTYDNLLYSINYIVVILTIAAGGLAVIVLYNLTNINIHERTRELAALRVLGYHHIEVAGYIYREITILSFLGTIAGLFLGTALERYVVYTAETTEIMFGRMISPWSYVIAAVATLVFSAIVDLLMSFKLRKIEMVESMKAVD